MKINIGPSNRMKILNEELILNRYLYSGLKYSTESKVFSWIKAIWFYLQFCFIFFIPFLWISYEYYITSLISSRNLRQVFLRMISLSDCNTVKF